MPKTQTLQDKARLADIHKLAAIYATERATAHARHRAEAEKEIEAVRVRLATTMWEARKLGTADAWIREAAGISGFYQAREMYDLGKLPDVLAPEETVIIPRIQRGTEDRTYVLTLTREDDAEVFDRFSLPGDVFTGTIWEHGAAVDSIMNADGSANLFVKALQKPALRAHVQKEVQEWLSEAA